MIFLFAMQWDFVGSSKMLEYEEMKLLMGSQGAALLSRFLDPSRPCVSLGEIYKRSTVAGWSTNLWPYGKILVIPKSKLEILSHEPFCVTWENLLPLIGFNAGF